LWRNHSVERVLRQAGVPRIGASRPSRLDPWQPFIRATLEKFPSLTASRLYAMVRERGYPAGHLGDVIAVEFTVMGIPCLGLNGGPAFRHNEAFSFQVATDDQAEADRLWNAIVRNSGQESDCGWCKDKWGLS
jgi:hypothetical protein